MLVLPAEDVAQVLDVAALLPVVEEALIKQARGEVERPERPHYPVGAGLDGPDPSGTGIAMPAYVYGAGSYATKLVGVHEGNEARGLPTVQAQLALTDARTGQPLAYMAATDLTNARTACIGGLSVRALAPDTTTLGVLGAGAQACWQTRAVDVVVDLDDVRVYSPSDSREGCAADLYEQGIPARAVESPGAAVENADTVLTATTATEPVFPADALAPGALVVAVGAFTAETQEVPPSVVEGARRRFADVPAEVAETGDLLATDCGADDLVPFGAVLADDREESTADDGPTVVFSVGSATMDAAAGGFVYRRAVDAGLGTDVGL